MATAIFSLHIGRPKVTGSVVMLMSLHCWSFMAMEEARSTKVLVLVLVDAWKTLAQGLLPIPKRL